VAAHEVDRVGAADQQVPGVDAEQHVGVVDEPLHLGVGLDVGADVRVQHGPHAERGGAFRDVRGVVDERRPFLVRQGGPLVVAVEPGGGGEHQHLSPGLRQQLGDLDRLVHSGLSGAVQCGGEETTDKPQTVSVQQRDEVRRGGRQVTRRAQFGRGDAERGHLAQHRLRRQHPPPTRHFADTPRDRRRGDLRHTALHW
jgi:hypothetical protein